MLFKIASTTKISALFPVVFLLLSLQSAHAQVTQHAQVGYYNEMGEIVLIHEHLLSHFPDGQEIDAIAISEEDGFLFLSRKARDETSCAVQLLQLVDYYGTPLVIGSDPFSGKAVFIRSSFPTRRKACENRGCLQLEGLQLPDSPVITKARCNITQVSQKRCACHINRGYGPEIVNNGELCRLQVTTSDTNLESWLTIAADEIKEIPE